MDDRVGDLIEEFVRGAGRPPEEWLASWRPSYNIRPTDEIPILVATLPDARKEAPPRRRAALARWWLTPPNAPTLTGKAATFNARSESVTRRPTFRGLVRSRRAVIPASGYYEWRHAGDTRAEPYYIHPAEGLLYFAGLYSWWADPARPRDDPGRWHLTTTILTRAAVGDIRRLHDRAPVTLPDDLVAAWVDPRTAGDAAFVAAAVDAATPVT